MADAPRQRAFATLDVFTARRFAGNPLAVVIDGDGLSETAMQTIAREFNLSETVFIQPARDEGERAFLRIFTPGRELPFAGHPTVGTAVLLGLRDCAGASGAFDFTLGEPIGPVACAVRIGSDVAGRATFVLPAPPERAGALDDRAALAAMLGLDAADIGFGGHAPSIFSAGVPFPLVPVGSRAAIDRIRLAAEKHAAQADRVFVYCREPVDAAHHFHARMFAPGLGVREDPATGSAVAALAGAILEFDKPADGTHRFVIEQGYAMGRPSQIELTLHVEGGALARATIGGGAVLVATGTILA